MRSIALITASLFSVCAAADAQLVIGDDYNVTSTTTGFALDAGVNTGINPPVTRLTGSAAGDLRYINLASRSAGLYGITNNKLQIGGGSATAATSLSANGTTVFDFSSVLGSSSATPSSPVMYEIAISMANNLNGATPRFSLGFGTTEPLAGVGQAPLWDFGIQLCRNISGGTAYSVFKRIDQSSGEGLAADDNTAISTTADGTYGSEMNFVIRITDAGEETSSYSSRVQVSLDGGGTFTYDSETDPAITGFRFDGPGRYFTWDVAGNSSNGGYVQYDNFSVVVVPEPSTIALGVLGSAALLLFRRRS